MILIQNNLIKIFEKIKNINYEIPIEYNLQNSSCSWKAILLKNELEKLWIKSNFRVCSFYWKDLNLPIEILNVSHDDFSTHVYLEIELHWKNIILDPTWDNWLKNIFSVNNWDWKSNTTIAVKVIDLYSIEKSNNIMKNLNKLDFDKHIEKNKLFYKEINLYFKKIRNIKQCKTLNK